jgi:hypothetical protein
MAVTVAPTEFTFVLFDAAAIEAAVVELLERLGIADRDVAVEIDETSPIARVRVETGTPIVLKADSGAFEDTRQLRGLSTLAVATSTGRVLLRMLDRERDDFAGAPSDDELDLPQAAAWDSYSVGRLGRLGYEVNRQRWLYNFRNRHGFTDVGDGVFEALWTADDLSWARLSQLSEKALAARQPA